MARTKIVATVGPACNSPETLLKLVKTGVDVFRINMAHGSRAVHQQIVEDVRLVSEQAGRPLAILVDLAGPKIRLGQLPEDPIQCEVGSIFHFVRGDQSNALDELTCTYETLCDELDVCNIVMLADGAVAMEVVEKHPDRVSCLVICGGEIRSRQGVNLPGVDLKTPSLTAEDRSNTHWAVEAGVDFLGLSFVRRPEDILELKELLEGAESPPAIIAKIEKREALDNLEAIAVVSHGVMVARGDLGVEIDVAETPLAQKRIIEVCRKHQRPVIVATQMLDSMENSQRPTRAEATDVANAVLDGADACMLSGETAIGAYPVTAVATMERIMQATETSLKNADASPFETDAEVHVVTSAVVHAAAQIARQIGAKMVVIATRSGGTARVKAKQRNFIPTIGVSNSERALRRMCLYWGVTPISGAPVESSLDLRKFVSRWGRKNAGLHPSDRIVFVTGTGMVEKAHNVVTVHEVSQHD